MQPLWKTAWSFLKKLKNKNFYTAKETINKTERQPTAWEKIFANDICDKGLVSKIYKELTQLKTPPNEQTNLKMGRRHEQTFLQRHTDGQHTRKNAQHDSSSGKCKSNLQ